MQKVVDAGDDTDQFQGKTIHANQGLQGQLEALKDQVNSGQNVACNVFVSEALEQFWGVGTFRRPTWFAYYGEYAEETPKQGPAPQIPHLGRPPNARLIVDYDERDEALSSCCPASHRLCVAFYRRVVS